MGANVNVESLTSALIPGQRRSTSVRVRNTGAAVDQFEMDVVGDVAEWAHVDPPTLNLMPGEEGEAQLVFDPPQVSRVREGEIPYALRVISREDVAGSTVKEGVVAVAPFSQLAV